MEKKEKIAMLKALLFALKVNVKDNTTKRLIIDDFLASANRKGLLTNDDVRELLLLSKEEEAPLLLV